MNAYDRVAEAWSAERRERASPRFRERWLVDRLVDPLSPGANVLDVGCGCGEPIGGYLARSGFRVTGVDLSPRMIGLARRSLSEATFVVGDMRRIDPGGPFDALVAWDSVFHVPRAEHAAVFDRFRSWLRPGGRFLVSLGGSEGEFTASMLGETFFYSSHEPSTAIRLLESCGFEVEHWEVDDPSSRGHVAILAERAGPRVPTGQA
ncbi:MAG: class I SAM-dependent methyltransferase [Thermoanaerobaculia bacterium]